MISSIYPHRLHNEKPALSGRSHVTSHHWPPHRLPTCPAASDSPQDGGKMRRAARGWHKNCWTFNHPSVTKLLDLESHYFDRNLSLPDFNILYLLGFMFVWGDGIHMAYTCIQQAKLGGCHIWIAGSNLPDLPAIRHCC